MSEFYSLISIIITVSFGLYAFISSNAQQREHKDQQKEHRDQQKNLQKMQESLQENLNKISVQEELIGENLKASKIILQKLTTKPIGFFPEFIPQINDCLQEANGKIYIASDVPAYGIFSNPSEFIRYEHIIKDKEINGIEINIITLSRNQADWIYEHQFLDRYDSLNDALSSDPVFYTNFKKFQNGRQLTIKDFDDLKEELLDEDNELFNRYKTPKKWRIDVPMPIQCWVIKNKEGRRSKAIFTIRIWEVTHLEQAFETEDEILIDALISVWNVYKNHKGMKCTQAT